MAFSYTNSMMLLNHYVAFIFACSIIVLVRCNVIMKDFITDEVCSGHYGTILESYNGVRGKIDCGALCVKHNCTSFLYNTNVNTCTLNSEMFSNKTTVGCSDFVLYAEVTAQLRNNAAMVVGECGEIPLISSIKVNNESGNYSVGSRLPYNCSVCTSFTPDGSSDYIECGIDGLWILPEVLCVFGADVGHLRDGTPIPNNATGCLFEYNNTCPENMVSSGFRFDGTSGSCYCDGACCNAGDCCFDSTCEPIIKKR